MSESSGNPTLGALYLICLEVAAIVVVFLISNNWSVGFGAASLAVIIPFFIYFLASFSEHEDQRRIFMVLTLIIVSLGGIIVIFGHIYSVIGLSDANNNDSKIYDVYDCLYFSLVTFTTVGYGDFHPVRPIARAAACCEALSGYIVLGVLVAALTNIMRPRR